MGRTVPHPQISPRGEPVWEIAELFPEQGSWTEEQYLRLTTNRLVEFDNGMIEALPLPTKTHQLIVALFYELLKAFIAGRGRVIFAPYRLRIPTGQYREPDVMYLTAEQNAHAAADAFTTAATLVIEVVSADDPERDYVKKREDYARANIAEYWIVDARDARVTVLRLEDGRYVEHGRFAAGQQATSTVLAGFSVPVDDVMSQGK